MSLVLAVRGLRTGWPWRLHTIERLSVDLCQGDPGRSLDPGEPRGIGEGDAQLRGVYPCWHGGETRSRISAQPEMQQVVQPAGEESERDQRQRHPGQPVHPAQGAVTGRLPACEEQPQAFM